MPGIRQVLFQGGGIRHYYVAARGRPPPVPASDQGTGRVVFLTVERPEELFART